MTQTKFNLVIVDEPYHKWSEVCATLRKENKQLKKFCEEFNALNVSKENQRLKELLDEAFKYVHQDCLKNLRVGYTPTSCLLVRDIKEVLKDYRRKNASEVLYVEEKKND